MSTKPTNGGGQEGKGKRIKTQVFMGQDSWYTIACVVAALTVVNVIALVVHRYRRRNSVSRSNQSHTPTTKGAVARTTNALFATYQNVVHLTSIPAGLYSVTLNEMFWTIAYTVVLMVFCFYGSLKSPNAWSNQAGYMAYAQIPFIVGLAGKNNTISLLTGIGYEKLNFLHRASGRVCLVASWVHTFGRVYLGLKGKKDLSHGWMRWGVAGLIMYTLLTVSSFRPLRNRFYEVFLISHILLVFGYLLSMWLHWSKLSYWIYPGFILWGLDRFVRLGRLILMNKLWLLPTSKANREMSMATVELFDNDTLRVTATRPGLKWSPGQHAYVMMPSVTQIPFEAHPFTISGMPEEGGEVTFIMKMRDGFTRRLRDKIDSSKVFKVPAYIEGAYGNSESLTHYDTVLLLTGGSGVTYSISHLVNIVREVKAGKAGVRKVVLIWMTRSVDCLQWIEPILARELVNLPSSLSIEAHLHFTKTSSNESDLEKVAYLESSSGSARTSIRGSDKEEEDNFASKQVGKSSTLMKYATWHVGRANVGEYLDTAVVNAQGPVAIAVCGPGGLQNSARQDTRRVNKAGKILKGQQVVSYHTETFGW